MTLRRICRWPLACALATSGGGRFVSRGRGTHPTRITDFHELIVVHRGVLAMQEDGDVFRIQAGETLCLTAGHRHGGTAPYPPELSFSWFHFHLATGRARAAPLAIPRHGRVRRPEVLDDYCRRFLHDQELGLLTPATGGLLLSLMLAEVARADAPAPPGAGTALAGRAREWLLTHHHEAVSTCDVAAALGCHGDYLGRVYRRTHGCTLIADLHRIRLEQVRRRLRETSDGVEAIAHATGLTDGAYLRRLFRRAQGVSPRAYRQAHARAHLNTE